MTPATALLIICAVALVAWIARQVRQFHHVPSPARPDRHLPAEEYALLGDDYRDKVASYFAESFIRHTRNRFAVYAVTGADPEKSESRDVDASGSLDKGDNSLADQN